MQYKIYLLTKCKRIPINIGFSCDILNFLSSKINAGKINFLNISICSWCSIVYTDVYLHLYRKLWFKKRILLKIYFQDSEKWLDIYVGIKTLIYALNSCTFWLVRSKWYNFKELNIFFCLVEKKCFIANNCCY